MSGLLAFIRALGPEVVREAGRHVGNKETEFVFEVRSEDGLLPFSFHEVLGEGVSENSVGSIVLLVVVDQKLFILIVVKVDNSNAVS